MMTKFQRKIIKPLVLAGTLLSIILTGCTDKTKTEPEITSESTDQAENPRDPDDSIAKYEAKWANQTETEEDYLALAQLYHQNGLIRKERDLLEQCYRLFGNADAYQTLQSLSVNMAEEPLELRDRVIMTAQNLTTSEYRTEAAADLIDSSWMMRMMPKLKQGHRIYYMDIDDANARLILEVGYSQSGSAYTNLWYLQNDTNIYALYYTPDSVQLMTSQLENEQYQGDFQSYLAIASTGDIYHETGTFQDGILTGNYTAEVHFGTQSADLFALISSRDTIDKVLYRGHFNEEGITTETQDTDKELTFLRGNADDNYIIYAYTEDGESFLSLTLPQDAQPQNYTFTAEASLNIPAYPKVTPYTPGVDQETDTDPIKVRIYDANIEWFNGSKWIILGSVADLSEEDPFITYAREGYPPNYTPDQPQDNAQLSNPYQNRGGGTLTTPSATKPSKPKPNPSTPSTPGAGNNTGGGNTGGGGNTSGSGGNSDGNNSGGSGSGGGNTGGGNGGSGGGNTGGGDSGNTGGGNGGSGGNTGGGDSGNSGGNDGGNSGNNTEEPEFTPDDLV